eukprot:XP_001705179.1 Hypothetical protein GL50803_8404 [Giardia lamblia ATCC 50803]
MFLHILSCLSMRSGANLRPQRLHSTRPSFMPPPPPPNGALPPIPFPPNGFPRAAALELDFIGGLRLS